MSSIAEDKDFVLGDDVMLDANEEWCYRALRRPKHIATLTICGAAVIYIDEDMPWIRPTEEQIKNLHDLLCIDVELLDDDEPVEDDE